MKFKLLALFGLVFGLTGCAGLQLPPNPQYGYPPNYYEPVHRPHYRESRVVYVPVYVVEEPRRGLDPHREHHFHWR